MEAKKDSKRAQGAVTSLSSIFPVEETQKAAKKVEESIVQKQNELNNVNQFISDNNNLISLISRLPDQLHHDIMVPFGKAAFFPGKLIHTNELMVLLGEGYYAERTAKQTVEILKRRGKVLDSQVESIKANIKDLRAEASFFDSTAFESAEGLVEIREDYVEESSSKTQSTPETDQNKVGVQDDEYARIMSRLDELEKEELEAEGDGENDEDENAAERDDRNDEDENAAESDNENEDSDTVDTDHDRDEDENEQTLTGDRDRDSHEYNQTKLNTNRFSSESHSEIRKPPKQPKLIEDASIEALSNKYHHQLDIADQSNCTGLTVKPIPKDDMSSDRILINKSIPSENAKKLAAVHGGFQTVSSPRTEVPKQTSKPGFDYSRAITSSTGERPSNRQTIPQDQTATPSKLKIPAFDSSKAFTGSIVERAHNLPTSQEQTTSSPQSSNTQPSKPVSRFKMQRR